MQRAASSGVAFAVRPGVYIGLQRHAVLLYGDYNLLVSRILKCSVSDAKA